MLFLTPIATDQGRDAGNLFSSSRNSDSAPHISTYELFFKLRKTHERNYRLGLPINRLIMHHWTRVNILVFSCGKDSRRQMPKSFSPSNSALKRESWFKFTFINVKYEFAEDTNFIEITQEHVNSSYVMYIQTIPIVYTLWHRNCSYKI